MKTIYNSMEGAQLRTFFSSQKYDLFSALISGTNELIGMGVGWLNNKDNQVFQRHQQEAAEEFNAQEAQKNRDFQAQQLQQQYGFQREQQNQLLQFNRDMWQKEADYNSAYNQVGRLQAAGLNPNLFAPNAGTVGGVQATSASAPSAPAGSQGSVSPLGSPNPNPWNSNFADSLLKLTQAKKVDAETEAQWTYNDFQKVLLSSGIKLNDAQAHKLYSDSLVNEEVINKTKEEVFKIRAEISKIGAETEGIKIDNLWKDELFQAELDNFKSKTGLNDTQAKVLLAKLPAELSVLHANADCLRAEAQLTKHQISEVDAIVEGLSIDNNQKRFDYVTNLMYGRDERLANLRNMQNQQNKGEYENSTGYRIFDGTCKFVGSVGTIVGAVIMKSGMQQRGNVTPVRTSGTPNKHLFE